MNSYSNLASQGIISEVDAERCCNDMVKLSAEDGVPRHLEVKRGNEVVRIYNTRCIEGKWRADLDYVSPYGGLIDRS
jgi:hypothetical protein